MAYQLVNMKHSSFLDLKHACDSILNGNFPISKATMLNVSNDDPDFIQHKSIFNPTDLWNRVNLLKKRVKPDYI